MNRIWNRNRVKIRYRDIGRNISGVRYRIMVESEFEF